MGLRALLLVYVVIILPLFFAPYYAFIRDQPGVNFTFALFFAMVVGPFPCSCPCPAAVGRGLHENKSSICEAL